jgi:DNA-directed RNA polymerase alpha subunit
MSTGGVALSEMNLVLPKVETEASAQNYGRFSIGPLESGYGITRYVVCCWRRYLALLSHRFA